MSLRRLAFLVAACLSCAPLAGCATRRGGCDPCCGRVRVPTSVRPADPFAAAASVHGRGRRAVWTYLASRYDRDRDGRIRPEEHPGGAVVVKRLDDDGDGLLTAADFDGATRMAHYITALVFERIAVEPVAPEAPAPAESAGSSDGMPSQEVLSHAFEKTDRDRSGTLDAMEVVAALDVAMRTPAPDAPDLPAGVRPFPFLLEATDADANGRVALPEILAWRAERAERAAAASAARAADEKPPAAPPRRPEAPAVGAPAPDFTLTSRGGTRTRSLSDLRGSPVVLVFGSYTCPPFRASAGWIRAAYDRHGRDARFLFIYVREAHAIDGRVPMPDVDQPIVEEPTSFEDRRLVADACALRLRFGVFETLVDDLDDTVARAYVAPPARLYVIDRAGTIAYRSGPGPFGLKQAEFEAALRAVVAPPAP